MTSRWDVERAVRGSDLPAPARLVILTIATWSDPNTAAIPARYTPSLSGLAAATGLGRSTVAEHLKALETAGWIVRRRPTVDAARKYHERTLYRLCIPAGLSTALVQEPDHLVQQRDQPWSRNGTDLVQERDTTRPRSKEPAQPPSPIGPPCGQCGPGRLIPTADGTDRATRCPTCHPKARRTA